MKDRLIFGKASEKPLCSTEGQGIASTCAVFWTLAIVGFCLIVGVLYITAKKRAVLNREIKLPSATYTLKVRKEYNYWYYPLGKCASALDHPVYVCTLAERGTQIYQTRWYFGSEHVDTVYAGSLSNGHLPVVFKSRGGAHGTVLELELTPPKKPQGTFKRGVAFGIFAKARAALTGWEYGVDVEVVGANLREKAFAAHGMKVVGPPLFALG